MSEYRVGIDIGGTFTDITVINESTGQLSNLKVLTTNKDPASGVIEALTSANIDLAKVSFLSHGTTIAINALLERKGAKTALITTEGFKDILEMRRGARTHILDPQMDKPHIFVPRRWRIGVKERVLWDGSISIPLDEEEVIDVLSYLESQGIESIAICFLHSYANRNHEQKVSEIITHKFPHIYHTMSAGLVPEIKEYERTSTAALNAYIQPSVRSYLEKLESELQERGLRSGLHLMQSNGGVMTAEEAGMRPIHIMESGPAAGSIGAAAMGQLMGIDNLITFDMGGTTTKASVIESGNPLATVEFELFEEPNKPGSGWPIRVPMIDLFEAGAGGGSIAWIDEGGALQVGPQSAGAEPGPVCYGNGGEYPTITDANAILGRLVSLLNGDLLLDIDAARSAMNAKIAKPLGLTTEEAAAGVLEIADAKTADVIREVTIARGRDPRDFTLVGIGGAGPLQAAYTIGELEMPQAIIPPVPGNFSALGLLSTDIIHDEVRTCMSETNNIDPSVLNTLYSEMEVELNDILSQEGIPFEDMRLTRSADFRYKGQFHIVNIPVPSTKLASESLNEAEETFHQEHLRLYTYFSKGDPTEIVNVRLRGTGKVERPQLRNLDEGDAKSALSGTRLVYFQESQDFLTTSVYSRHLLGKGSKLRGPAIVEEQTSTTLIPPSFIGEVDQLGNIIIRRL